MSRHAFKLRLLICFMSVNASAGDLISFRAGESLKNSVPLSQLSQLAQPQTLKVFEPHERAKVSYRGYPTKDILNKIFGAKWKKAEVIFFTCADGYKSPVPEAKIESEHSVLAFKRLDQPSFTLSNHGQNEKDVSLAPLYLVWDNLNGPYETEDGSFWPYQVVGIELATFAEKFPNIVPPPEVQVGVERGFKVFQQHCLSCHKVNGNGGEKGPELNFPLSVTEQRSDSWLRAWIDDPAKVLFGNQKAKGPTMPPLNKNLANRPQAINDVIAYLKEMAKNKIKPSASNQRRTQTTWMTASTDGK